VRRRRSGAVRTIRNIAITVVVLLVLFGGAAVGYLYFMGNSTDTKADQAPIAPPPETGLPKPTKPAPNAPEQASIEVLTSPVPVGSNASASVKTNAGSTCSISVTYNNVPSKDSGLVPRNSDDYGNVTWSWTVDKTAPVGTWPVKITCVYNISKKSAVVVGNLQVTAK
jgi:hypothetical protein